MFIVLPLPAFCYDFFSPTYLLERDFLILIMSSASFSLIWPSNNGSSLASHQTSTTQRTTVHSCAEARCGIGEVLTVFAKPINGKQAHYSILTNIIELVPWRYKYSPISQSSMNRNRLSFMLRAGSDIVLTPINCKRWRIQLDGECHLCNSRLFTALYSARCHNPRLIHYVLQTRQRPDTVDILRHVTCSDKRGHSA